MNLTKIPENFITKIPVKLQLDVPHIESFFIEFPNLTELMKAYLRVLIF